MPEDRSLDEFSGSEDGSGDADAPASRSGPDRPDSEPDPDATAGDPTPATATWTAGGAECERCGDRVERRWLDDGDRVCPACKSW